jgi:hypothetical protein
MNRDLDDPSRPARPRLTFSPLAWLKLMFFAHHADTEVGGFGLSAGDDPLRVEDFLTVRQRAGWASVGFDDDAVADHFDACADAGLPPDRCGRVWVHTHPGDSALPSGTDEETFARVFGRCDWAVMLIVSRTGRTYARLSFPAGPGGSVMLTVSVDWSAWPQLVCDGDIPWERRVEGWMEEFHANIRPVCDALRDPAVPPFDEVWDAEAWAAGIGPEDRELMTHMEEVSR